MKFNAIMPGQLVEMAVDEVSCVFFGNAMCPYVAFVLRWLQQKKDKFSDLIW